MAIGVFSLTNLSLNADTRIRFLGKAVTVGFSFCTRERPFTLAVAFLGGGGFFGIRLSPQGLEVLEMSLEFGAIVALDFGVASGSVSAMAGIYIRLEGNGRFAHRLLPRARRSRRAVADLGMHRTLYVADL